ncbi:CAP domain-containing protein [Erythrobacter sp. W53]|uniref:CAP domain-containing protein n=1 Tax=Erythrobacteraceae TaxID=335929 RepID=UPI0036D25DEE
MAAFALGVNAPAKADDGQAQASSAIAAARLYTAQGPRKSVSKRLLENHNSERTKLGLQPLRWNAQLEAEAARWGETLAGKGYLQHADQSARSGAGENLWMGTAGYWDVDGMFKMFIDERKDYRHKTFPNVSRTGDWKDVGHYTQIVWRDTREVGCAVVTGNGNDVLVCRYWPAGNVLGSKAY